MPENPIYFRPSSIHVRESNALDSHLFTSGNPMLKTLTLNLGCKPLTLTSNPTLKRRQNFFSLMLLVFFFFSLSLTSPIYFRPSFIHVRKSNASDPHLFTSGNPMLETLTLTFGCNALTLTPIYRTHIHLHLSYWQICPWIKQLINIVVLQKRIAFLPCTS